MSNKLLSQTLKGGSFVTDLFKISRYLFGAFVLTLFMSPILSYAGTVNIGQRVYPDVTRLGLLPPPSGEKCRP